MDVPGYIPNRPAFGPAPADVQQRHMPPPLKQPTRAYSILAVLCVAFLAIWIAMATITPIVEADEARYVQVAREMIAAGNWFSLRLHGEPYDQKPPVPFWMIGLALKATGGTLGEWAVRMPSMILAALTLGICGWIGIRRLGTDAGLCAALILGSTIQFLGDAPKVELNIPFTFWTTLAVAFWLTRGKAHRLSRWRVIGLWGAVIMSILTKGPLSILIIGSILVSDAVDNGGLARLRLLRLGWGAAFVMTALVAYLGALAMTNGTGFVKTMVHDVVIDRVLDGDHEAPAYFYLAKLPSSILVPWTPVLLTLVWHAWRTRGTPGFKGGLAYLGWTVVPTIILSLAHGKRESYAVPLLPGFALLFAWFFFSENRALVETRRIALAWAGKLGHLIPSRRHCITAVAAVTVCVAFAIEGTLERAEALEENPKKFGAILGHFVSSHSDSDTIGAFEKADGCEYYTYSPVNVRELELVHPSEVDPGDWPVVLTGRKSDWRKFADTAILNGYVPVRSVEAAGERIHIWARPKGFIRPPKVAFNVLQE